jgi:hypothetical protein
MRPLLSTALWLTFFGCGFLALNSSLADMTKADCRAGIHRACEGQ